MTLEIIIPTYNRCDSLLKNLNILQDRINEVKDQSKISIRISDNASSDKTEEVVRAFADQNQADISIRYHKQLANIGLEQNVVDALSRSKADYVMFLGDDDYLPKGYMERCLEILNLDTDTGCIIPGLASLLQDGQLVQGRIEEFSEKKIAPGWNAAWEFSHLGHQMSGLICRRPQLLESYLANPDNRNIYLFIYFVTECLVHRTSYYLPVYKVEVTTFNTKDWGYNTIGLLDEVYKNYYSYISTFGECKVRKLMIRFAVMHSYRLNISSLTLGKIPSIFKNVTGSVKPLCGFKIHFLILLIKEYLVLKLKR